MSGKRAIVYHGWIAGKLWERSKWRQLGVKGEMRYNSAFRAFEYCEISPVLMQQIIDERLIDNPSSFTAAWADTGEQLPKRRQLWGNAPVQL